MKKELRSILRSDSIEVRSLEDGKKILSGRGISFDQESEILWTYDDCDYVEVVPHDCEIEFNENLTLSADHRSSTPYLLGRLGVNLKVQRRNDGVYYECELPNTSMCNDFYELVKSGMCTGCSFEFCAKEEEFTESENGSKITRSLKKIELYSINPLFSQNPAYKQNDVEARSSAFEGYSKKNGKTTEINNKIENNQILQDMTITELKDKRANLLEEVSNIQNGAKNEKRSLKQDEQLSILQKQQEARSLYDQILIQENEIELRTQTEGLNNPKPEVKVNDKEKPFLLEERNQKLDLTGTKIESRAGEITNGGQPDASTAAKATEIENVTSLQKALVPELYFQKMGITMHSGIKGGNLRIPIGKGDGDVPSFVGENTKAGTTATTFTDLTLMPKRLPVKVILSKRFIRQDAVGATAYVLAEAKRKLRLAIESRMFSNQAKTVNAPAGLFNLATSLVLPNEGVTYAGLLDARKSLKSANVVPTNVKMITSTTGEALLMGKQVVDGQAFFLLNNGKLYNLGNSVVASNIIKSGSNEDVALFGDFANVHMGIFNDVEVTYDPYTLADQDYVQYVFNFECDWGLAFADTIVGITGMASHGA